MVEIRKLAPIQQIRMPTNRKGYVRSTVKVVRRTNAEYPPPTPQPTPCRLWQGVQGSDGYGWRKIVTDRGERKSRSVHRWVMEQVLERRLKPSEVILHACDNPLCYRVDHLSVGTVQSNNADMKAKGRSVKPPIHHFHGEAHPMRKLNGRQVAAIRGHYQSGLRPKTIAEMYGISASQVRRIVNGVSWAIGSDRDLIAEAKARIEAQVTHASGESGRLPRKRIAPVKHLSIGKDP